MKPEIRRVDGLLHLRYRIPHHIHCSAVYPRSSPEGCEIVLCGHENGLLVLWRGGSKKKNASGNASRSGDEDAMAVDDPSGDEDEIDEAQSYAPIRHHINLPLGIAVRHVACLRLPQSSLQDALIHPELLRTKVVIGLACGDNSVRLLTFPLASSWAKQRQFAQEEGDLDETHESWPDMQFCIVSAFPGISSLPRGVSIALSFSALDANEEGEASDGDEGSEPWEILVAHHSKHLSGKVYIHRIQLSETGEELDDSAAALLQTIYLSAPASSAEIIASTDSAGSKLAKVLISFTDAPMRVFECPVEADSGNGKWMLSLAPGIENLPGGGFRHKAVLEARWALGGNVILVLLSTGDWLLYDVSTQKAINQLSGAIPARPTLTGRLGTGSAEKMPQSMMQGDSRQKMVPMTPGTRKSQQDALFHGRLNKAASRASSGGITIVLQKRAPNSLQDSESVVLWHGASGIAISDLAAYWRNRGSQARDPFSGGIGAHARVLPPASLDGELRTGVAVFAHAGATSNFRAKHSDVLVAGELSLLIVAAPLAPPQIPPSSRQLSAAPVDGSLLTAGELDIGGLDRMLDIIESKTPSKASQQNGSRHRARS